jgi:hypothetical protein
MMMTEKDWAEFREKFPQAASWMDYRTLQREKQNLRRERDQFMKLVDRGFANVLDQRRLTWINARLEELTTIDVVGD